MNNKELGKYGEELACKYLERKGYVVLERNFYCKQGEIDIIAKDENTIVFLEVKTRRNLKYGIPAEAVDKLKQSHIFSAAKYYLYKNRMQKALIRFDVIEVYLRSEKVFINQIKNIIA